MIAVVEHQAELALLQQQLAQGRIRFAHHIVDVVAIKEGFPVRAALLDGVMYLHEAILIDIRPPGDEHLLRRIDGTSIFAVPTGIEHVAADVIRDPESPWPPPAYRLPPRLPACSSGRTTECHAGHHQQYPVDEPPPAACKWHREAVPAESASPRSAVSSLRRARFQSARTRVRDSWPETAPMPATPVACCGPIQTHWQKTPAAQPLQ